MSKLTRADVEKIAHLARLQLSEEEKEAYLGQLTAVLDYAAVLNELDLEGVPPSPHAVAQQNIMRDDVIEPSLPIEDTFHNAPQQANNQFLIQSVLDE
ncbi:MAG: Asp-tRNA(Asn)/Glu-tRNA(Gln) amidotransferase subunit GatC [Chloroflexi bacterium]|nr:Asp-tRNA(Asn)/Glu-tRNA(Gln) amidotransferase subunit GatC [Chloroflexota bacterium]